MSDIKWIKITTTMFEDEKIDFIESLPESDMILIIWVKLLTLAGKINAKGYIFLTENIPYSEEMLAHKFKRPLNVVKLALDTFIKLGMVEDDGNGIYITNWEKYQNIEGMERVRELNRLRKRKERENKQLMSRDSHATSQQSHATDIDKELDKDIDKEEEKELHTPYEQIKTLFNDICISFPSIRTLSNNRKKSINARWKQYEHDLNIFKELFTKAESSNFLKGDNERKWSATFDWLLNENNMTKVLEGTYNKKKKSDVPDYIENQKRFHQKQKEEVETDEDLQAEVSKMLKEMEGG